MYVPTVTWSVVTVAISRTSESNREFAELQTTKVIGAGIDCLPQMQPNTCSTRSAGNGRVRYGQRSRPRPVNMVFVDPSAQPFALLYSKKGHVFTGTG
jgi:hypothetical protein